jgi:FHA domain
VDDPLAVALKFGFLAVLYLFLLWVSRSALRDLARTTPDVASERGPASAPEGGRASDGRADGGMAPRLEVIAALGHEPGTVLDIRGGATLGRAEHAEIRVDDPFSSSAHARIFPRGGFMQVEDLGSTNGTYLNGRRLRGPERLKAADVVRIGDSEYRYLE